ncbi:uncharacterized protein LOC113352681 [Papaver somniferum]|uniref:uncharacterized protein LOC113352681 n=1 Tax=Papaver somniferum TaxID=3469 RepID=UPI000E703B3E|nr:uncharacterized protein LOC113352681 [Papaver somniferum]
MALATALGHTTGLMAETWGLLLATRLARQQMWQPVWFKADSLSLVQMTKNDNENLPWYIQGMLQEIKMLMTEIPQVKLTQEYREANQAADKLANEAIEYQQQHPAVSATRIWDNHCQPFISNIVTVIN